MCRALLLAAHRPREAPGDLLRGSQGLCTDLCQAKPSCRAPLCPPTGVHSRQHLPYVYLAQNHHMLTSSSRSSSTSRCGNSWLPMCALFSPKIYSDSTPERWVYWGRDSSTITSVSLYQHEVSPSEGKCPESGSTFGRTSQ